MNWNRRKILSITHTPKRSNTQYIKKKTKKVKDQVKNNRKHRRGNLKSNWNKK